jgi:tRNA G18 (ribose-2'-O)-methylase SpoU
MKKSMSELGRLTREDYEAVSKLPLVMVLDNIRSQHNVGSVFRTSDAFRVASVCLCGITATPPNKEIQKSALGATDTVSWKYYESTLDALAELKAQGYVIIGIEQTHNCIDILDKSAWIKPGEKLAVVMGNEVFGASDEVLAECDRIVEIQQFGTKHSLNVSVCAGIVIWEICKWHFENKTIDL